MGEIGHLREMVPSPSPVPDARGPRESGPQLRQLGPYRLEGTLGRGGFGTVYRATDLRTQEPVALKVLHREVATHPEMLRRFLNEARTTSAADNPHVVRAIDSHEDLDGYACIAFELLAGETLQTRLRREGVLPPGEAIDFAIQILDGLEVAHERGIVHRDVKPANLFLVADELRTPCVKILDFGISRLSYAGGTKLTATGASMGSPFYMAPEQVLDASTADARADLYGVAVCLYRMLSGGMPHGEGPASAWLTYVARGGIAPRVSSPHGELPAPLVEAVALGLSARPDARWQNAAAFSSALLDSLPGASAATRVSYEPAAVLRAPMPAASPSRSQRAEEAPAPAGRSGRHAAIAMHAVHIEARVDPPPSRPMPLAQATREIPLARTTPEAPAPALAFVAAPAETERRPSSRTLWIVAALAVLLAVLVLLVGGVALAFVVGEAAGRSESTPSPFGLAH